MDQALSLFNLLEPTVLANPYPFYRPLLEQHPVYWDQYVKAWVCVRYKDVLFALHSHQLSAKRIPSVDQLLALGLKDIAPLYATLEQQLLFIDPPDHSRLRRLMSTAFTTRKVEAMRPYIEDIVHRILDRVEGTGFMDIIHALAYPLPLTVIAELLGLPLEDRNRLKKWSDDYAAMLGSFQYIPDQIVEIQQSISEMMTYFRHMIEQRRQHPQDDLISVLIAAYDQDDQLTDDNLITNCILLLAAGHETTTNLIGNGILTLLNHPDQLHQVREDPSQLPNAVEEILRYESPAQYTARLALDDLEISGKRIHKGQVVILLLGAANRDPFQFENPEVFDIQRQGNKHLAFGYAAHFCLGAPLARLEGQIAIHAVIQRFPRLRLMNEKPLWRQNVNIRGLSELLVAFD